MKKSYLAKIAKIGDTLDALKESVDEMVDELESAYEDHSEAWQESDAAAEMEEDIDNLQVLSEALDEAKEAIVW